jgi:hypothetical protein
MIATAKIYGKGGYVVIIGTIHNSLPCNRRNNAMMRKKLFLMYPKLNFFTVRDSEYNFNTPKKPFEEDL